MNSISINDPRTQVTEVYIDEVKLSTGTEYEIRFKVKGNSAGMSHFSTRVKPDSLSKKGDDKIAFVDKVGNNITATISPNGVFIGGTGFTQVISASSTPEQKKANEKKKKERKEKKASLAKIVWKMFEDDSEKMYAEALKAHKFENECYEDIMSISVPLLDKEGLENFIDDCTLLFDDYFDKYDEDYAETYAEALEDKWEKENDENVDKLTDKLYEQECDAIEKLENKHEKEEEKDKAAVKAGTMTKDEAKERKKARKEELKALQKKLDEKYKKAEDKYDDEFDTEKAAKDEKKRIQQHKKEIVGQFVAAMFALAAIDPKNAVVRDSKQLYKELTGKKFDAAVAANTAGATATTAATTATPAAATAPSQKTKADQPKKSKKGLYIGLAILVIIILLIAAM